MIKDKKALSFYSNPNMSKDKILPSDGEFKRLSRELEGIKVMLLELKANNAGEERSKVRFKQEHDKKRRRD